MGRSEQHSIPTQAKIVNVHCEQHKVESCTFRRMAISPIVPSAKMAEAVISITSLLNVPRHPRHHQTAVPRFSTAADKRKMLCPALRLAAFG